MAQLLFVPVKLDALVLAHGATVLQPYESFDGLPYVAERDRITGARVDVHANRANTASDIDADAFSDQNLFLPAGVHLHWTLPEGLSKGLHTRAAGGQESVQFPPVPNRWLVVRRSSDDQTHWTVRDRWMVESDALFQLDSDPQPDGAFPALTPDRNGLAAPFKVPVLSETAGQGAPPPRPEPYRYMGRATEFPIAIDWRAQAPSRYLPSLGLKLSVLGYGDATYAAFYPNCATVFGLYDQALIDHAQIRYDVFGWHGDAADDALDPAASALSAFLSLSDNDLIRLLNRFAADHNRPLLPLGATLTGADRSDAFRFWLEDNYAWQLDAGSVLVTRVAPDRLSISVGGEPLAGILCYSSIILDHATQITQPTAFDGSIAVGNTGSEALAAWMAFQIAGDTPDAANIEEQLEAATLAAELNQSQVDLGPRFREARHAKGFTPVAGESAWTIRPASASSTGAPPDQPTIPDDVAHELNQLNAAQFLHDRADFEVNSWRQRLFSKWHLYMKASYPDNPDFLGTFGNDPLIAATLRHTRAHELPSLAAAKARRATLAADLAAQGRRAQDALTVLNSRLAIPLLLQRTGGPRYWAPNDPVLFFGGDPRFQEAPRYVRGPVPGRLRRIVNFDRGRVSEAAVAEYLATLDALLARPDAPGLNRQTGSTAPWNPFLLEWEAVVETESLSDYAADFVEGDRAQTTSLLTFTAPPSTAEFPDPIFRPVRGRTLLKVQTPEFPRDARLPDSLSAALAAHGLTAVKGLAQSLGGFNSALLMRRQTYQLPLADPITFTDRDVPGDPAQLAPLLGSQFRRFTLDVVDALGGTDDLDSPEPGYGFYPLHQGRIRLLRLRIVDTFGQALTCYDLEERPTQPIVCSLALRCGNPHRIGLPPRITQPARLDFRWLSAASEDVETTEQPAATPICGWVLPNHLDESLAVFAADGAALGSLDRNARWRKPPGPDEGSATAANIGNPRLRQLVQTLAGRGQISGFLSDLEDAIDNIDPDNFAQHQARALLIGRPLALVRARVQLELRDLPATDQSWADLRRRVDGAPDGDRQFQNVKFPIRIGDHAQFNDGVAVYWEETAAGLGEELFPKDQADDLASPDVNTRGIIWQSLSGDNNPLTLFMLVDPRAGVHASCGVLPTKTIGVPVDQFADSLKRIEVSFLTAPVLTDAGRTRLPLPADPDLTFFWVQRETDRWSVIPAQPIVRKQAILDAFPADGERLWTQLALDKWIALDLTGLEGRLLRQPQSGPLPLNGFENIRADVQRAIDRGAIGILPVQVEASFGPRAEIREGWLQLTPRF